MHTLEQKQRLTMMVSAGLYPIRWLLEVFVMRSNACR
jgi:hypothetical protein